MVRPRDPLRRVAPAVSKYGLSLFSVTISMFATSLLQPSVLVTPLFFPSIMLSTWISGTGPGLFAVLLSTLSINYFFLWRRNAQLQLEIAERKQVEAQVTQELIARNTELWRLQGEMRHVESLAAHR